MATSTKTWDLEIWVDDEPNSRYEVIDSDHLEGADTAAEAMENLLERETKAGEYRVVIRDADGVEIDSAEGTILADDPRVTNAVQ